MADDDPVQPDESGQGGEASENSSPWAEYLDRITDEEARGVAEEGFKAFDANTTRKFQEAAEYKKQWEPLEELGVNQRDPAEVEWAMQFVDALQNPSAIKEWFDGYAKEHGLTAQEQQELEQEFVDPSVESLVEQRLQAQLGPIAEQLQELAGWRSTREQQEAEDSAMAQIESQLGKLEKDHPDEFDRGMVEKLLPQYIDSDPQNAVNLAFKDWQAIHSQITKDALQGKLDTPSGAVAGGSASGTPDPPPKGEVMKYAAAQALEQLRAANRG